MKKYEDIFQSLIRLREKLGVPESSKKYDYGEYSQSVSNVVIQLESDEGITVDVNEIELIANGSLLAHHGNLVIVYISDTQKPKEYLIDDTYERLGQHKTIETKSPKYHFMWCAALAKMKKNNRYDRYVLRRSFDGLFKVFAKETRSEEAYKLDENVRLYVCQYCLAGNTDGSDDSQVRTTAYKDYSYRWPYTKKSKFVKNFNIKEFIEENDFIVDSIRHQPRYTDDSVEANNYTHDFREISRKLRENCQWKCSKCFVDMSENRKNLHVHHKNGLRNDNRNENLQVLCVQCHKDVDAYHSSMKTNP